MDIAEALGLIEQIIEEHRVIFGGLKDLDQRANDVAAIQGLHQAQEGFIPGRLTDQKQALSLWQESLSVIDRAIQAHFNREETALVTAITEYGGNDLVSTLRRWLAEHADLRERLAKMKIDVEELLTVASHHVVWQGKAWGIRVYMTHTGKIFDTHARGEQKMLLKLHTLLQTKTRNSS